jgi:threonylcarbamoyladenosine tRNA methylthiotransferase MtaB
MRVHLASIGCRLNQSEIEGMARQLTAAGHEIVKDAFEADKVVVNTCAVTHEATKDARRLTRRIHKGNPEAEIFLTGCYATIAPEELARIEGAGRIVANKDKRHLAHFLDPAIQSDRPVYELEPILREVLTGEIGNTRAFVKVQDGCNNRCTFCVTTIARGSSQSRHLGDIIAEIQGLVAAGYQEAVLTGVHLGSYGKDLGNGTNLTELINSILYHTDIPRLRLSSLEPWDIVDGFFELWQDSRLLPHLHVPLQSGSDRVLQRMARRTTRSSFRRLAKLARASIPELNLSTDLIVGFPGESGDDFVSSLDYVAEIGFSRLHVFTYSQRPGTAAAKMDGQLPNHIRKQRAREMIELGKELSLAFHRQFEGQSAEVLWERAIGADGGGLRWTGYSRNYIRIIATSPEDLFNRIIPVHLSAASSEGMSGTFEL